MVEKLPGKYESTYEHIRIVYKLKKGEDTESFLERFNNWVSSVQSEGMWQIGLWSPMTGGENAILVCDRELLKEDVPDLKVQMEGLDNLIKSHNVYRCIHSRASIISRNDGGNLNRNLVIFHYRLKEGKSVSDFLDWFTPFWMPDYKLLKHRGNEHGVEMVGVYDLIPQKPNVISCHYHICNSENWKKKSVEMKEPLRNLIDSAKTRVKVYSLTSVFPETDSVSTRMIDYTFEKGERLRKGNGGKA